MLNGASGPIVLLLALPNKKKELSTPTKIEVDDDQDGRLKSASSVYPHLYS